MDKIFETNGSKCILEGICIAMLFPIALFHFDRVGIFRIIFKSRSP